jgi:hypothetical protein
MGSSGKKRKDQHHLPKVGTAPERAYAQKHERQAVEENMGIRPGGMVAWIAGALVVVIVVVSVLALISFD